MQILVRHQQNLVLSLTCDVSPGAGQDPREDARRAEQLRAYECAPGGGDGEAGGEGGGVQQEEDGAQEQGLVPPQQRGHQVQVRHLRSHSHHCRLELRTKFREDFTADTSQI